MACKACDAPIRWCKTVAGKTIPLDPQPHPDGNIYLDDAGRAVYAPKGTKPGLMYLSHFATCPEASKFRRSR